MDYTILNTFISTLAVALISGAIKGIVALNRKVGLQNGRLGKMETWLIGHEKLDDERHKQALESVKSLWAKMDER